MDMTVFKRYLNMAATALVAAVLFLAASSRAEAAASSLVLGNCKTFGSVWTPVSGSDCAGSALFYPGSIMKSYEGCRISELHVYLDVPTEGGAVTLFLSHSLDGTPAYSETTDATTHGWHTFRLKTPYAIDGGDLFIGYTVKGASNIIYMSRFVADEEWIWSDGDGWKKYDGKYSAALYATVEGAGLPLNNVRLGIAHLPQYVKRGAAGDCWAEFQNLGAETVTSVDVAVVADGVEKSVETIGGLDVKPREGGTLELSSYVFDAAGESSVRLEVKAVNGKADAVPGDNVSKEVRVRSLDEFWPRKTLLEVFSTEKCTACPAAHEETNSVLEGRTDVVELCHHAGFMTDKYTLPESKEYEWFYKQYNVYAPAFMADRTSYAECFPSVFADRVPMVNLTGVYVQGLLAESQETPGLVGISVVPHLDGRSLSLDVEYAEHLPLPAGGDARLYVFLTEDSVYTKSQAGASKGFWHRNMARQCLTAAWGDAVALPSGKASFTAVLPEKWDISRMSAVAFVANYNPDDKNDCRVYNAESVRLADTATGIESLPSAAHDAGAWAIAGLSGVQVASGRGSESLEAAWAKAGRGVYVVKTAGRTMKRVKE